MQNVARLRGDARLYIEHFLKIRAKDQRLIPFQLNEAQRRVHAAIQAQKRAKQPVRLIILKARQQGISTLAQGLIFHGVTTRRNAHARVIAHESEPATGLFEISKLFYEELPDPLKPMRKYSNQKALVFDNPKTNGSPGLRSRITVDTAQDANAGRSSTIHFLHASEVAFWPHAEATMLSLMQAVPDLPNTMVLLESTANGVGGYFYDQYWRAKRGESDFQAIFLPWHAFADYTRTPEPGMVLTEEEEKLKARFNLTDGQIAWRRWCIANNCGGDVDKFKQEYPADDHEAFLVSGRPVFDVARIRTLLDAAEYATPATGYLVEEDGQASFVPDPKGFLTIHARPQPTAYYTIGADVAEGLAHGDYSAAHVINRNMQHVARWHGHLPPDAFAEQLALLGRYYNNALIGCENNNHGLTTNNKLRELGYRRLYRRRTYDQIEQKHLEKLGWETNAKTRPLMLDRLGECIRKGLLETMDTDFLGECLTFVRKANGRMEAQPGAHDDLVIAMAIALQMHPYIPRSSDPLPDRGTHRSTSHHIERIASRPHASDTTLGTEW